MHRLNFIIGTAALLAAGSASAQTLRPGDVQLGRPIAAVDPAPLAGSSTRIIGGGTEVTLTAADALTSLGLSFAPFGTASLVTAGPPPRVNFLITGGSRDNDTGDLLIEHAGSGLTFSGGGNTLRIGDFLIDTDAGSVSGSAFANGTALGTVPLFTIGSGLRLLLTPQAAGAFTSVFGAPDLGGTQIGTVITVPVFQPIPEPQAWALMIAGFALAGATARRRGPRRVVA